MANTLSWTIVADECRATLESPSRTTAVTSRTRSAVATESNGPSRSMRGAKPIAGWSLDDDVHHRRPQSAGHRRLELEDRDPDLLDGVVEMLDDLLEGSHGGGVLHARCGRLDDKTRGEHLLDDVVVQVAGDPGPVLEEQDALLVVPGLGQLECDRGVVGEGRGQLRVGLGEGSPSGATHHDQRPPDLLAAEQRQDHDRSGADLAGEVDRATVDVVGVLGVDHPDGRPGPHHVLAQGAGGRVSGVLDAGRVVTLGHRDAELGIDRLDHAW